MKLPAKTEYAIKAAFELSRHYGSSAPVSVEAIAESQNIPQKFLVQILVRLGQAGIVRSVRGMGGGYLLSRHPSQITLLDIFVGIDKSFFDAGEARTAPVALPSDYALRSVWSAVNKQLAASLSISLEQLQSCVPEALLTYEI